MRIKVIIHDGIVTEVLCDGLASVEIISIDKDNENCEKLKKYEQGLKESTNLSSIDFTMADSYEKELQRLINEKMGYDKQYEEIWKAIQKAGFDGVYRTGLVNQFHKMDIGAESSVLGLRYRFCIDSGVFYITVIKIGSNGLKRDIECHSEQEMIDQISVIHKQIEFAKENDLKEYKRFKLQWMLEHGFTLEKLMQELDELREEADSDESLESIFEDWEFNCGIDSLIWPYFQEYVKCEGARKNLVAKG